jgi:hypothetical protein
MNDPQLCIARRAGRTCDHVIAAAVVDEDNLGSIMKRGNCFDGGAHRPANLRGLIACGDNERSTSHAFSSTNRSRLTHVSGQYCG